MSDTGSSGDNKPQQQDELNLDSSATAALEVPEVENKPVTPVKRTPSKRVSAVERAQRESEELVKTMGGSLDIEGGRKTRSSTRGTPSRSKVVDTPPPTKKARATAGTPRRGKGRKLDTTAEDETKITPEKISSEPESVKEDDESSAVDAAKIEEKITDDALEATETSTPPAAAEEQKSPAKQDEKPEPMEVDGVTKEKETPAEPEHVAESAQNKNESSENAHEGNSNESDKPVAEQQDSSTVADLETPAETVEEANNVAVENKIVENSVGNNVDATNKSEDKTISEVSPTIPPPAPPVSVAGNEHKAESNDFCEPKIASPPITANNEGATPQYCN